MAELPPQTLAWLRQSAALDGAVVSQTLLNLLERVEALEKRSTCKELQVPPTPEAAPVATDNGLLRCYGQAIGDTVKRGASHDEAKEAGRRACYNLGRQHGAAQPPAAQPAPVAREVHFEFAVVDGDYNQQAGGTAPTYSQALSEGNHYLAQYLQDGPHTLEIRRIELLPQAGEVEG